MASSSRFSFIVLLGLITIISADYIQFLNPPSYSVLRNTDDSTVPVHLPTPTQFGSTIYSTAYVSSNGLISFGTPVSDYSPIPFPLTGRAVLAPYWDDIHLYGSTRELRYAILTPNNGSSIIDQVNCLLSNTYSRRISVDWILWTYWYNVCPYQDNNCNTFQSNYFQAVLAVHNNSTYSIFIYQCGLIRWTRHNAIVGFSANHDFYANHSLSETNNVVNIDCIQNSEWTNIVYQLNDLSALVIWPPFGTILGGDLIQVSGPQNLNKSENIRLSFDDDSSYANCTIVNNTQTARCVAPFLNKEGRVIVRLYYNNTVYNRTAMYHSLPMENNPKVNIGNVTKRYFTSGDKINITWSSTSFSNDPTSKVDVSLYEIKQKSDGTFENKKLTDLATGIPNNGQATVTVPMGSDNNRVCSVNILVQKNVTSNNGGMNSNDVTDDIKEWSGSLWVSRTNASTTNTNFLYQKCLQWEQMESAGSSLIPSTTPCPPTVSRAAAENSGFQESNFLITVFHPLASRCFRQRVPTSTGSGNQCCYRSDGTLIVGPPSGGSIDKVAPTGTGLTYWGKLLDHFREDVLPYIYCCVGEQRDCNKYYDKRPSDDGSRFSPPVPACVYGDPHIVTLDLHKYTFNGKGEFVLIESIDDRSLESLFAVQGRMIEASDMNGNDASGTVFSAVAAKQGNSDIVQFEIDDETNEFICLVNGERIDFSMFKTEEFSNVTVSTLSENDTFSATFSSGPFIKVQASNGFISVLIVSLPDSYRGQTRGLMGNFNGNTSDDLIPKNGGPPLPLNSTLQQIHDNFGLTWIVNNSDNSLFSYPCGRSWATYHHPSFRPSFVPTFSDPSLEQTANEICGNDEFCKFDIAATGRVEVGEATFTGGQNFEQLVNLSQPITCNPACVHGACVATDVCACGEGYTGVTCNQIITTPCTNDPCNGGICQYHAGSFICTCPPELTGVFCEENYTTPCTINPCKRGGTCFFELDSTNFTCVCPAELTGPTCELNITTPCTNNPCQSGGTCMEHGMTNFSCICPPEYTGIMCELEIKEPCIITTSGSTQIADDWVLLAIIIILVIISVTSVCIIIVLVVCLFKERSKRKESRENGYPSNIYDVTDKHELVEREAGINDGSNDDYYEPSSGTKNYSFNKY